MLLKSKFSVLEGYSDSAQNLICDALNLAKVHGLIKLADRVEEEEKSMLQQIKLLQLKEMKNSDLSIQEKLNKIELQSYLKKALNMIKIE